MKDVETFTNNIIARSSAVISYQRKVMLLRNFFLVCCLLVLLTSCKKSSTDLSSAPSIPTPEKSLQKLTDVPNHESGPAKFEVCGLLKPEEIKTLTGTLIKGQKSSGRSNGSLQISQCVYEADELSKSLSLVVTQTDSARGGKEGGRDFWQKAFGRYAEGGDEKDKERERDAKNESVEEEEHRPPRRIEGLGEEAFWTAGSLYVLNKDAFIRVSIGGTDTEETKLTHSKALAEVALKRL